MKCPYLIVHGGHDVLGVAAGQQGRTTTPSRRASMSRFALVSEEETGADHCQHDNPTIGQELMADWLADVFGIDERELRKKALNPLI